MKARLHILMVIALLAMLVVGNAGPVWSAAGDLDLGFSDDGRVVTSLGGISEASGEMLAVQPDGKIVVMGDLCDENNYADFALERYNADGTLDTSFGTNGTVRTNIAVRPFGDNSDDVARSIAIQPDGKVVVVGDVTEDWPTYYVAIARYTAGGALDTTFGSGGIVTTKAVAYPNYPIYHDAIAVALQSDGGILVLEEARGETAQFLLLRFNADGSLDTTFGTGGIVEVTPSVIPSYANMTFLTDLAVAPDNSILVAGGSIDMTTPSYSTILKHYSALGVEDTSPGYEGVSGLYFSVQALPAGDSYEVYATGLSVDATAPSQKALVVRYLADGSYDAGFGDSGQATYDLAPQTDMDGNRCGSLAVQPDGKLVLACVWSEPDPSYIDHLKLMRCLPDGTPDTGFGTGGVVEPTFNDLVTYTAKFIFMPTVAITPGGKLVTGHTLGEVEEVDSGTLTHYHAVMAQVDPGSMELLFTWTPAAPTQGEAVTFSLPAGANPDTSVWAVSCEPSAVYPSCWSGNPVTGATFSYTFREPGTWWVTLDINDENGNYLDQQIQAVSVANAAPQVQWLGVMPEGGPPSIEPSFVDQPVFAYGGTVYGEAGATCTIDYGDGSGTQTGTWIYWDWEVQHCEGPLHTYTAAGDYTLAVTVTDPDGLTASYSAVHQVVVKPPAPVLSSISPASTVAVEGGTEDLTLTVNGSNFTSGSVVRWNGVNLVTTFVDGSQLTAVIPAYYVGYPGTAQIDVYDATPGEASNVLAFFITQAAADVTAQDAASGTNPSASVDSESATATGDGLLVVAEYDANPADTPTFTASGSYFDVYVAPDSSFSQVEIVACGLSASDTLYWWEGGPFGGWEAASPQSYADGCITLLVTDSSSPTLGELGGTVFVAGRETTGENTAPVANPGGPYLAAINTAIAFDGSLSADADGDALTYAWTFGDGASGEGASPSHSYTAAAVYNVCLTVNDGTVDSGPVCTLAVVYDPSAGFVTGGGWIDSQPGAYKLDETLSGKATFGFVSKYLKGATVPTGNTEFQFQAGNFNFRSTAYDWLVVSKDKVTAQFKGSGTVNGELDPNGNAYKFLLWAGDGSPDTFRIKIWWEDDGVETDVYDNGVNQAIGGGSIVVHTK